MTTASAYTPRWDAHGRLRVPVDAIAEPVFPDDGAGWDYLRERRRLYQLRRRERDRIPRSSVPLAWVLILVLLLLAAFAMWNWWPDIVAWFQSLPVPTEKVDPEGVPLCDSRPEFAGEDGAGNRQYRLGPCR